MHFLPWPERGFDTSILEMPKNQNFWDNFSIWLQSCQILQPGSYLDMTTALGLTPFSSPEPVVSWSRGWETRGATGWLQIKSSGSGDENGLTPDSSSFKLHINFCCLIAKNFIWICKSKECFPIHNNFLFYLRHIYPLENKTPSNKKMETFLFLAGSCLQTPKT